MSIPDKEAIDAQVLAYAEAARELNPTVEVGSYPEKPAGVVAPIYMGKAHDVVPDSYVLHYSVSRCSNCSAESRETQFFALNYIKSRINGTRVRHLIRCDAPWYNLPVRIIPTGTKKTPYCAECPAIDLSHLPPPPSESQLHDLAEPQFKNQKPKTAAKETKKPTLDDLI